MIGAQIDRLTDQLRGSTNIESVRGRTGANFEVGKEFASKQPEHEVTAADATELGALGVAPGVGPVYH